MYHIPEEQYGGVLTQPYSQQPPPQAPYNSQGSHGSNVSHPGVSLLPPPPDAIVAPHPPSNSAVAQEENALSSPGMKSAASSLAGMKFTFVDPTAAAASNHGSIEEGELSSALAGGDTDPPPETISNRVLRSVVDEVQTATQALQSSFPPPPAIPMDTTALPPEHNNHVSSLSSQSSADAAAAPTAATMASIPIPRKKKTSKLKMRKQSPPHSLSPKEQLDALPIKDDAAGKDAVSVTSPLYQDAVTVNLKEQPPKEQTEKFIKKRPRRNKSPKVDYSEIV
eukprot:10664898-Ditylum_brightwellii.AAC.1